jgi:acyl-CoA reductase-like NAD-dependent aldehyde dehydrogenase
MTTDLLADFGDIPTELLINGKWRPAADGSTLVNVSPVDERMLAEIAAAGTADIDTAVRAARAQFDGGEWSRVPGPERGRLLLLLADLIERDGNQLAGIQSMENGVSTAAALAFDVGSAVRSLRYYAGWADKIVGSTIPVSGHGGRPLHSYTVREPRGVLGAIIPWNAPLSITVNKIAPALAAGCAVVLKPAEDAQLTVLRLGALINEAGFPPGVVNVLPGWGDVAGEALAAHPGVDHISFTGSAAVGRRIQVVAAETVKRTTLELGGKSPQLIFADADIDAAVMGTAIGLFANQGQVCAAASRILVDRQVYGTVVAALAEAAGRVRLGDPREPDVDMGPLINRRQLDRVLGYIDAGKNEGARLVVGGERPARPGFFVRPAIFADASNDMTIAREEIFGPVGTVIPFDSEAEATALANDTVYGLTATVWTGDISRAHRLARQLRAGSVWINGWGAMDAALPWGGMKRSGVGRELGWAGIEDVTEEKVVTFML